MGADTKPGVDWPAIKRRYERGEAANAIAVDLGTVSRQAILKRAKRYGWSPDAKPAIPSHQTGSRGLATPGRMAAIVEAVERGLTVAQAAALLKLNRHTVHNWTQANEDFAAEIAAAETRRVELQIANISRAGETDWRAAHTLVKAYDDRFRDTRGGDRAPAVTVNIGGERGAAIDGDTITIDG